MKLSDVQIGGRYTAKVSGKVQVVRITEILSQGAKPKKAAAKKTTKAAADEAAPATAE